MSCYEYDLTQRILNEREKQENTQYSYPDVGTIGLKKLKELPEAVKKWREYVRYSLSIDWQDVLWLTDHIPMMASAGVIGQDEILRTYKEMIRKCGSRTTQKAENLILDLCKTMPLATRKGN